jgi:hypothetical protein
VEIADRQQVGLTFGEPSARGGALTLRAVPVATTVIGDPTVAAVIAGFDVTTERRCPAMLDRRPEGQRGAAT